MGEDKHILNTIKHPFCNFYKTVGLILKDAMEEAGRALLKTVPVEAEVVIADSWERK